MKKIVIDSDVIELYDENWQLIASVSSDNYSQLSQYGVYILGNRIDFGFYSNPDDLNSVVLAVEIYRKFSEVVNEG